MKKPPIRSVLWASAALTALAVMTLADTDAHAGAVKQGKRTLIGACGLLPQGLAKQSTELSARIGKFLKFVNAAYLRAALRTADRFQPSIHS